MITAFFANLFAKFGKQLIGIGSAIAALALLFLGHKYKVNQARDEGTETGQEVERARVKEEVEKKSADIKVKAAEISEEIDNETREISDLRKAMRNAATDSDNN